VLIQAERLTHTYAPRTPLAHAAVQEVSLEIPPGQRVGIIGSTGSGKSTLVQLFAGLLKPTAGQVLLDGVPAHRGTRTARKHRRRIGLAFQYPEDQFFERTVFREVAFGLMQRLPRGWARRNTRHTETADARLSSDQLHARVQWALSQVGLDPAAMLERSPLTLSGGEMRRVALASVLVTQPQVLILDEPTAGLDPQGRRALLTSIQSWGSLTTDLTLIVISHNLGHLARLVERVIVLVQGRIAADGPAREVLSDPALLRTAGLEVPPPVELMHRLRAAGWPVRTDRISSQEAVAEIARAQKLREDT
jgi:energy-coupling factor transport system ATP-binding protein